MLGDEFPLGQHLAVHNGYPIADWAKVQAWVDALPEKRRAAAWSACERAWLLHFRDALGKDFRLDESDSAAVLSSLEPNVARATLEFMGRTLRRIGAVLAGIVEPDPWGKDILIVFDDEESYYRYVSYYYPEKGEFAFSGGMHIHAGCSHYVAVKNELRHLETVIAHEMTHACLEHLPLPTWLNEGLAVNTEQRLTGVPRPEYGAPELRHDKLRRFWSVVSIQEFWSGQSFYRPGAGAAAARKFLGLDLGELVTALLERDTPKSWSPDPTKWDQTRGEDA